MSNLLLVNDALSLIGVLPEGQDASAEQGTLALRVADELVDEWSDDGIIVSWDANPDLSDECVLRGVELNALKHVLAVRLCPHFGKEPPAVLVALAAASYGRLARQQMVIEPSDPVLPRSEGDRAAWDITQG